MQLGTHIIPAYHSGEMLSPVHVITQRSPTVMTHVLFVSERGLRRMQSQLTADTSFMNTNMTTGILPRFFTCVCFRRWLFHKQWRNLTINSLIICCRRLYLSPHQMRSHTVTHSVAELLDCLHLHLPDGNACWESHR